ncbi:hypothetical protein EB796_019376 [Bugula neritina]|uniref:Uncharacterized protein n=1 Tax=Bugula neritina TaxID=10212 RepID=A0A7J7J7Y8_BUGNE|nr:hypothetical protein EB796_019376 [Bugula neritina]
MISCDYLVPTSSYASPALPNKLVEFNRRETYIVKTRPVNNSSRAATPILLMPPISSRSPVQPSHAHKARQEIPRSNTYKFQHRLSESRF